MLCCVCLRRRRSASQSLNSVSVHPLSRRGAFEQTGDDYNFLFSFAFLPNSFPLLSLLFGECCHCHQNKNNKDHHSLSELIRLREMVKIYIGTGGFMVITAMRRMRAETNYVLYNLHLLKNIKQKIDGKWLSTSLLERHSAVVADQHFDGYNGCEKRKPFFLPWRWPTVTPSANGDVWLNNVASDILVTHHTDIHAHIDGSRIYCVTLNRSFQPRTVYSICMHSSSSIIIFSWMFVYVCTLDTSTVLRTVHCCYTYHAAIILDILNPG